MTLLQTLGIVALAAVLGPLCDAFVGWLLSPIEREEKTDEHL